jgi:predicted peroxiredoxin
VHTGPDDPTKATLRCLVAATAAKGGHETAVFLAGDGARLLHPEVVASLEGHGTGRLADHLAALAEGGARLYLSVLSARARGYDETLLEGYPAEFAVPDRLVTRADAADTVICY